MNDCWIRFLHISGPTGISLGVVSPWHLLMLDGRSCLNPSHIMAVFLNCYLRSWLEGHWEPAFFTYTTMKIDERYPTANRLYNIDAPERS
jgi:hypothetical protein